MQRVGVRDFLLGEKPIPIVDVRSPGEFQEGHIPGAINLPLFDDEERAMVGTTYTRIGKPEAIHLGLEIVGPKMNLLATAARNLSIDEKLKVHCWRGGMRSDKMAWLFQLVGLQPIILEGGYKAYRQKQFDDFASLQKIIVLQGPTGSGKTHILAELACMGEQVLDLEKRANHKGSAFGALGMGNQPSTAQFHNDVYADLITIDYNRRIWVESESLSIGKVYLPQPLWDNMNRSTVLEINLPKELRAARAVKEYGHVDTELLGASLMKIKDRFGPDRVKKALALLEENKLYEVAMMLLDYYDKAYEYSKTKYKKEVSASVQAYEDNAHENALKLIEAADILKL